MLSIIGCTAAAFCPRQSAMPQGLGLTGSLIVRSFPVSASATQFVARLLILIAALQIAVTEPHLAPIMP